MVKTFTQFNKLNESFMDSTLEKIHDLYGEIYSIEKEIIETHKKIQKLTTKKSGPDQKSYEVVNDPKGEALISKIEDLVDKKNELKKELKATELKYKEAMSSEETEGYSLT